MFIGIDIGGRYTKGVLTNPSGKEMSFKEIDTPETANEIDKSIYDMIEILSTSASISKIDIKGIGIGSAGSIDREKGIILKSPNIPALKNHPLVKNIENLTGAKVMLENDATIALIGAWWKGNGSKFKHWVMLTLGTGIGGGIIIDNKIYTGQSGNSMEVGHMTIDINGKKCGCGNTGCWERYASATALVEMAESKLGEFKKSSINERLKKEKLTSQLIYEEALNKDELALILFDEISTYIGLGVVNIINIFNPEAIIFGGGLSQAHKLIFPKMKNIIKKKSLKGMKESVQYFPIKDPQTIPALGAAKMAIDSINKS